MWQAKDRLPPTPGHFDECYVRAGSGVVDLRPEVQQRLDEVLFLVGDPAGQRILDLGGGALLGRACAAAERYLLVDMSGEGVRIASKVAPWGLCVQSDALRFLRANVLASEGEEPRVFAMEFDVTVAIGLVEYLPPSGLDDLFRLAPSKALAFTTAVKEAYLQYEARITVPSREDVAEVAGRFGWKVVRELKRPDHVWARYERS